MSDSETQDTTTTEGATSIVDTISAALEADEVHFLSETGKSARTPHAAILSAVDRLKDLGAALVASEAEASERRKAFGAAVLSIRSRFIRKDGRPDWNGETSAYKAVSGRIAAYAAVDPEDQGSVLSARNTVQKTAVRLLAGTVLAWVNKAEAVKASAADLDRLTVLIRPTTTTPLVEVIENARRESGKRSTSEADRTLLKGLVAQLSSDKVRNKAKPNQSEADKAEDLDKAETVNKADVAASFGEAAAVDTTSPRVIADQLSEASRVLLGRMLKADKDHPLTFGDGGRSALRDKLVETASNCAVMVQFLDGKPLVPGAGNVTRKPNKPNRNKRNGRNKVAA